jgi:hypothetical protein
MSFLRFDFQLAQSSLTGTLFGVDSHAVEDPTGASCYLGGDQQSPARDTARRCRRRNAVIIVVADSGPSVRAHDLGVACNVGRAGQKGEKKKVPARKGGVR